MSLIYSLRKCHKMRDYLLCEINYTIFVKLTYNIRQSMELLQQIDKQRELMGISKRELASKADITPEYYSKVLHDKADVSFRVLKDLAKAVNFEIKACFI